MPNEGDLKVWWVPQVPGKAFEMSVSSPEEGARITDILARYDLFQYEHRIKPDYSNAGGLVVYEDGEWIDWYDEDTGDDFDEWARRYKESHAGSTTPYGGLGSDMPHLLQ